MKDQGKERKDLGLHSRLGRPQRTNVFDSPEMNFPAVVTCGAKNVKASLQTPDQSLSKTDKILENKMSQRTWCLPLADEVFDYKPLYKTCYLLGVNTIILSKLQI